MAQASSQGLDTGTFTAAGATTAAVGALVYIARLMASGQLIAKNTAKAEEKQAEMLATMLEVNRELVALVKHGEQRERELWDFLRTGRLPDAMPDRPPGGE